MKLRSRATLMPRVILEDRWAGVPFATHRAVHRRAQRHNPYADLRALLDTTRQLSPEEMAELQLELGYVERALAIYEVLLRAEPSNLHYRGRCEWLARLAMAQVRPVRAVGSPDPRQLTELGYPEPEPVAAKPATIRPLRIVAVGSVRARR